MHARVMIEICELKPSFDDVEGVGDNSADDTGEGRVKKVHDWRLGVGF